MREPLPRAFLLKNGHRPSRKGLLETVMNRSTQPFWNTQKRFSRYPLRRPSAVSLPACPSISSVQLPTD